MSSSVDVVVSTKTNLNVFAKYFEGHFSKLGESIWEGVVVPGLGFQGSKFAVTVWFRKTPRIISHTHIDIRMARLLAGDHVILSFHDFVVGDLQLCQCVKCNNKKASGDVCGICKAPKNATVQQTSEHVFDCM